MKKIHLILILICLIAINARGQKKCMSFQEAKECGIIIENLDSLYPNAVHADSTVYAVFRGKENEFYNAYVQMLQDLGTLLKEKGFLWEKPTWCFNKIYLSKDGKIDYFLYNFRKGEISDEKLKEFNKLINEFQEEFHFSIPAENNFSQCGPVTYMDKKE